MKFFAAACFALRDRMLFAGAPGENVMPDYELSNPAAKMKNKQSFTLIELLITIAIIAILAGMLLPALNAARNKAKAIDCTGKLKSLGLVIQGYTDYYNDYYPLNCNSAAVDGWSEARWYANKTIYSYAGGDKSFKKLVTCPADAFTENDFWTSYGMQANTPTAKANLKDWKGPLSKAILMLDHARLKDGAMVGNMQSWYVSKSSYDIRYFNGEKDQIVPWERHSKNANILFADGHVESVMMQTFLYRIAQHSYYTLKKQ